MIGTARHAYLKMLEMEDPDDDDDFYFLFKRPPPHLKHEFRNYVYQIRDTGVRTLRTYTT